VTPAPTDQPLAGGKRHPLAARAAWRWRGHAGAGRTLAVASATVVACSDARPGAGDLEFASYVWQPWFIQLRGGVGALVATRRLPRRRLAAVANTSADLPPAGCS
jgi:hypothetical protein